MQDFARGQEERGGEGRLDSNFHLLSLHFPSSFFSLKAQIEFGGTGLEGNPIVPPFHWTEGSRRHGAAMEGGSRPDPDCIAAKDSENNGNNKKITCNFDVKKRDNGVVVFCT